MTRPNPILESAATDEIQSKRNKLDFCENWNHPHRKAQPKSDKHYHSLCLSATVWEKKKKKMENEEQEGQQNSQQNQHKRNKSSSSSTVIKIPSYQEVIESSQSKSTPPSLFNPSKSFSQAFSFIKSSEFYTAPPQPPPPSSNTISSSQSSQALDGTISRYPFGPLQF